jgi:hypothetical protein
MRISNVFLLVPLAMAMALALGGCISFSSSAPPRQTIVVPSNTTIVCSNGAQPPC